MSTSFPRPLLNNPVEVSADKMAPPRPSSTGVTICGEASAITVSYQTGSILSFTVSYADQGQRKFIREMNAKVRGR